MKNEVNKELTASLTETELEMGEPSLYQVILYNDDFTPMEFVVAMLEKFFYLDRRQATEIMMETHTKGKGICGIFSRDFAEAKVSQVVEHARLYEHPLTCGMEANN